MSNHRSSSRASKNIIMNIMCLVEANIVPNHFSSQKGKHAMIVSMLVVMLAITRPIWKDYYIFNKQSGKVRRHYTYIPSFSNTQTDKIRSSIGGINTSTINIIVKVGPGWTHIQASYPVWS